MKITIFTITDCSFSKQEKEYLSAHGLQFEEKNLESNREFLTEMLAVGSNFAGTPVTKIEKDDGQIVVLKGFTVAEFDKTLESTKLPTSQPQQGAPVGEVAPVMQTAPQTPVEQPVAPTPQPETPPAPVAPVEDPAMTSVLDNLEQQAQVPQTPPSPTPEAPPAAPVAQAGAPVIPNPQF